jgi:hypothetical protein
MNCWCLSLEKLYGNVNTVDERHRHRYEVNPIYIEAFEQAGMKFVGRSEDNQRMEIVELESKFREILFDQIIFFLFFSSRSSLFCRCSISSRIHFTSIKTLCSLSGVDLGT